MTASRKTFRVVEGDAAKGDDKFYIYFDCPYCGNHAVQQIPCDGQIALLTEYFSVECADDPKKHFLVHWTGFKQAANA